MKPIRLPRDPKGRLLPRAANQAVTDHLKTRPSGENHQMPAPQKPKVRGQTRGVWNGSLIPTSSQKSQAIGIWNGRSAGLGNERRDVAERLPTPPEFRRKASLGARRKAKDLLR